ncbi:MAG TPA: L-arabinose isomerase, partial [Acidimicrobiales bacterium]|nr:L-arabinose isomerase [Acidimicrobiales bacterium]
TEYADTYDVAAELLPGADRHRSLREGAAIELGLRSFLEEGAFVGFTTNFEDLHGLRQLPGLAVQRLMAGGYGFGAEGDWKTAAMVRAVKVMGQGRPGGTSFMEDYTYHLGPDGPLVLGAHMLETCPTIAEGPVRVEVHPLGIGGKADPVRLVFDAGAGPAVTTCVVDLGNRFRMVTQDIETIAPPPMPDLPVGRAVWRTAAPFETATAGWILAGGSHHTVLSRDVDAETLDDFATIAGIEHAHLRADTDLRTLRQDLCTNEVYHLLAHGISG